MMPEELQGLIDAITHLPMWTVGFMLYYFERKERIKTQRDFADCLEKIIISEHVETEI